MVKLSRCSCYIKRFPTHPRSRKRRLRFPPSRALQDLAEPRNTPIIVFGRRNYLRRIQILNLCHRDDRFLPMPKEQIAWPHAPTHQLASRGTYFVTAGTYLKKHHFRGSERLEVLHRGLLKLTQSHGWKLEAWAVFSNHYHFIAHSPADEETADSLSTMLNELHKKTANWVNKLDAADGRKVWHNYRETRLTYQRSYLARLNYVHQNPVKHHLVPVAHLYPWCSARWFERTASPAQIKSIYRFKFDQVNVEDDFEPDGDW